MQSRKSTLSIGFRTRRNVLKGKNVRKQADGADNFADYWTDSDSASTEGSVTHEQSDLSETQQALGISHARLETLRQNVRKSQNSKLPQTKVIDKLKKSKLTRSPLKSIKNNISSSVKDANRSLTNKQKISQEQNIHHNRTEIFSNNSTLSDRSGSHDDDEPDVYNRSNPPTSNANAIEGQTKNICNFSLPEANGKETLVTQSKVQSSKNIDEEESIESRASDDLASSANDHADRTPKKNLNLRNLNESDNCIELSSAPQPSTFDANVINKCTENASSPLSKKNKLAKTLLPQKSVPHINRNSTDIHVLSKTKVMHNEADSFHFTESNVQPLSGKTLNEKDDIVLQVSRVSNVFMTSLGNRTVRKMHNSIQVSKTFEKFDEYDAEIMQMAHENESLKLPGKEHSFPKKLNLDLVEKRKTESSPSKRTVKSIEETIEDKIASEDAVGDLNESQRSYNFRSVDKIHTKSKQKISKIIDGIDEELLKKSTVSDKENSDLSNSLHNSESETEKEHSPNSKQEFENTSKSDRGGQEITHVPSLGKKGSAVKPTLKKKSTPVFNISAKKYISNTEYPNRLHSCLNTTKTFSRSSSKRGTRTDYGSYIDEVGEASASHICEFDGEGKVLDTNENGDEVGLNFDNQMEMPVSNINKKGNASKNVSQNNIESATETEKENRSLHNKNKKPVNKTNENFKASETFVKDNTKSGNTGTVSGVSEINFEAVLNVDDKRKNHVIKKNNKVKASDNISRDGIKSATEFLEKKNETAPRLQKKKKKPVNKTNENLKSSETFMKDNITSGNEGNVSDVSEINDETVLSFDNKRKKHDKTNKNKRVKASENVSLCDSKSVPEFLEKENENTPSFRNKRQTPVNKTFEKLRDSGTINRLRSRSKNADIPEVVNPEKRGKGVNKRNESIFQRDDNDQVHLSQRKSGKVKKTAANATDNTVAIRKSGRQKFPPLSRWRNERPLYRVENGIINFVGIDHGTSEDKVVLKTKVKAQKSKEKVKKCTLDDAVTKRKIRLSLLKKFVDTPWDKEHESDKCPYRIKRPIQTFNSCFGYIEIQKNAEKPKQYMPDEDLYLSVIKGKLQCTVQSNICVLEEKDVLVIPRCIPYSLKNIGTTKALLTFCVGKFQSLESLE